MKVLEILSEIIINAGIAHGFVIAILFRNSKNRVSNFLLFLLLIDLSLIVFRIRYLMYFLFDAFGAHFFLTGPFTLVLGPLLYFYLRSIVLPGTNIARKDLIHFGLFFLYFLVVIPLYFFGKESDYSLFLWRIIGPPRIILIIQLGYYLFQIHRLIRLHKANIVEKFSNVEGMDVSWLNIIVRVFIIILVFVTITAPWLIHSIGFTTYHTGSALFFSLILFFIAYKGIQQKIPVEHHSNIVNGAIDPDDSTIQKFKDQLINHMVAQKPFLNPELTLIDLASQLNISRNQLSRVINTGIGDNFYYFVNKYRVEEVKKLIDNDVGKRFTIMSLAYDAGFNSKSTFNSIFKKITGLTPSEYRNRLL